MERLHPSEPLSNPIYRLGFLASYNGSAMRSIVEATETIELPDMIPGVVISENDSKALQFAEDRNIPNFWVNEPTKHERDAKILQHLNDHGVNILICSGYMKKVPPAIFTRIPTLNIHPADTRRFGGKGMYGDRVHEAVLQAGEPITLPTVHRVTEEYDEGPILLQREVRVLPTDEVPDLRERVKQTECKLYVEVLKQISAGAISLPS